jgi:hypothetical protein
LQSHDANIPGNPLLALIVIDYSSISSSIRQRFRY